MYKLCKLTWSQLYDLTPQCLISVAAMANQIFNKFCANLLKHAMFGIVYIHCYEM